MSRPLVRCSHPVVGHTHTSAAALQACPRRTPVSRASPAVPCAALRCLRGRQWRGVGLRQLFRQPTPRAAGMRRSHAVVLAMVNVDFSPTLLLGIGIMAGGALLYRNRLESPSISRDYDVTIASVAVLVGGILVFQGWRLDPLLLFGQLLTAGTAMTFALEVLRLRKAVNAQRGEEGSEVENRWSPPQQTGAQWLPGPQDDRQYQQWSSEPVQQDSWPAGSSGREEYVQEDQPSSASADYSQDYYADQPVTDPELGEYRTSVSSGDSSIGDSGGSSSNPGQRSGDSGRYGGLGQSRKADYDAVEDW